MLEKISDLGEAQATKVGSQVGNEERNNEKVLGYDPRYPQDKTWAAPSEVAQPTRSRLTAHGTARRAPQGYNKIL